MTTASGHYSHSEGIETIADGNFSHSEGCHTKAQGEAQHVSGRYNEPNATDLFQVGMGTSDANRKNAMRVTAEGDIISGEGASLNELNKNTTLLNATFENVDVLDKARTMPKGFTPISLSTGSTNKPTGLADYSNGFVLNRGGDTYTIFIINRTTGDIYTNTWTVSAWTGWKSVTLS